MTHDWRVLAAWWSPTDPYDRSYVLLECADRECRKRRVVKNRVPLEVEE